MTIVKPPRLREGGTVAVLSPSWGGPAKYPHVFDLGLRNLRELFGVVVKEYPTTRMDEEALYRNPRARAEDVNAAFADPSVRAIFASIGGDDAIRILPYLDLETIGRNPKIFMGYSDTTNLTTWLHQQGMVTFNGPSILAGFAQLKHLPEAFGPYLRSVLMEPTSSMDYRPFEAWVNKYLRWANPDYDGETEPWKPNLEKWQWLQGSGRVEGLLYGGCIDILELLKGTPYWPPLDFWNGRILFLEGSEEKPPVRQIKYNLRSYAAAGILPRLSGLLFGRARDYTNEEKAALYETVVSVVTGEFGLTELPIVANMDFGHTDPQWIVPLGVRAEIDCDARTFRLCEPAVS